MDDHSDAKIVRDSLIDPEAFTALFDRHFVRLHGYLAARAGASVADELAAEVFTVAFERRASFDLTRGEVQGWLYGIAINLLRRHWRGNRRQRAAYRRAWALQGRHSHGSDISDALDARAEWQRLGSALGQLAPREREPLLLYVCEHLSYAEIAQALRVPVGTVRSRISRARRLLRALTRPEGAAQGTEIAAPVRAPRSVQHPLDGGSGPTSSA